MPKPKLSGINQKREYRTFTKDSGYFGKYNGKIDHQCIVTGETLDGRLLAHSVSGFNEAKEVGKKSREDLIAINNKNWHLGELGDKEPYILNEISKEFNEEGYYQLQEKSKLSYVPVVINSSDLIETPKNKLYSDKLYEKLSMEAKKDYKKIDNGNYTTTAFDPISIEYKEIEVRLKDISYYKSLNQNVEIDIKYDDPTEQ